MAGHKPNVLMNEDLLTVSSLAFELLIADSK
jgi:hypothetical protein